MFKSNYFKLIMKLNKVKFGKNLNLYGIPVIFKKKGSQLNIGENCTIKSSFLSNLVGLSQRTIIVTRTEEAKIEIGNNVGISGATIYARKGISIGDNTFSKLADTWLPISTKEKLSNKISTFSSNISIHYLLDLIFACVFEHDYQRNIEINKEISKELDQERFSNVSLLKDEEKKE